MTDLSTLLRESLVEASRERSKIEELFVEEPVPLDVFFSDKRFLGNVGMSLSPRQFDLIAHAERIYFPETYPLLAEEFDPRKPDSLSVGWKTAWRNTPYWGEDRRMTNILTVMWGKGCLCPWEEVYCAWDGEWKRVDHLAKFSKVATMNDDGDIVVEQAYPAHVEGDGECFRVTLSTGARMDVYGGHQYFTTHGWDTVWNLDAGDKIAVTANLPVVEPIAVAPQLAEVWGFWIGAKRETTYALCDKLRLADHKVELAQRWDALYRDSNHKPAGRYHDLGKRELVLDDNLPMQASVGELVDVDKADVRAPKRMLTAPEKTIALFLSRVFSVGGNINSKGISFTTLSYGLATDLQRLGMRLGVMLHISEVKTTRNLRHTVAYRVSVPAAERKRFLSQVEILDHGVLPEALLRAAPEPLEDDVRWVRIKSIEPIGEHEYWDFTVKSTHNYVAGGGTLNHNSGKDMCCQVITARVAYLLSCLRSPQLYYGLLESSNLDLLNVAPNSATAHKVFFTPLRTMVNNSPWFAEHLAKDPLERTIMLEKSIIMTSGHSNAGRQEGGNLILAIADEIDEFHEPVNIGKGGKESAQSAAAVLKMIRTSGSTRFPTTFKNVIISWPRYLGSPIMRSLDTARADIATNKEKSVFYAAEPAATWVVNPRYYGCDMVDIPTSPVPVPNYASFLADFEEDPPTARAMYLCQPEKAVNPFFKSEDAVNSCFYQPETDPLTVTYRKVGHSWAPIYTYARDFKPVAGARYAMHADLAIKADRAGIAMAHVASWNEYPVLRTVEVDGKSVEREFMERRPVVQVDFVSYFAADLASDPAREIQIRWARQLALELLERGFNIRRFTCDGFQSVDTLQSLAAQGIETDKVTTDTKDRWVWNTVADVVYDQRLHAPYQPLLLHELHRLGMAPSGKVDHPMGGSKDLADAFGGAIVGALYLGGEESDDVDEDVAMVQPEAFSTDFELDLMPSGFDIRNLGWSGPSIW